MSGTITKATVTLLLWIPATLAAAQQPTQNVFHANKRSELVPPMDFPSNPLLRNKRPEIDLQTCIDNFNVHRDKIIRTQDSQNMGAKYLNEIDLGSRVECLKLCCETEDCDVFVFEEKNAGSCYLFHCGPPEDFKCKFTHHVNYSSAVLSINRHLPDLENEIKLTKHVQDLTKLRKPSELESSDMIRLIPELPETVKVIPTTTSSPAITKEVIPVDKKTDARKCRRDQFECRSNGECIAIYNACDGIQQCADGSDEAPVLDCPAAVEAVANTISQTSSPSPTRKAVQSVPVLENPPPVLQYGREGELVQQQRPQPPANYPQYHDQPKVPVQSNADFLRPVSDPRSPGHVQFESMVQMPNYLQYPGGNNWGQPPISQQNIQQQYQDAGNQVFARKEKTFHNDGPISQIPYPEYSGRISGYYGDSYRQPIQQESWTLDQSRYVQQPQPPLYHPQYNQAPVLPAKTEGTSNVEEPIIQEPISPNKITQPVVNPKHVQEKLAHDLKHSKDSMEHGPNQKVKIKTAVVAQTRYAEPYKMVDESGDNLSHVPRGAILSLTLGLILTGVMAILIGCRLRVVRRRLRKGEKYAHNADYLVNGMYL